MKAKICICVHYFDLLYQASNFVLATIQDLLYNYKEKSYWLQSIGIIVLR